MRQKTTLACMASAILLMAGCSGGAKISTYALTVNSSGPSSGVSIGVTSADNNKTSYATTSFSQSYSAGASFALTAPAIYGLYTFSSWSGCASASALTCAVTLNGDTSVTANYLPTPISTPLVIVTPSLSSTTTLQGFSATVTVTATTGGAIPTGTVTLSSGSYSSTPTTLGSGKAILPVPAGVLAAGSDALTASYAPDASSAPLYRTATGVSSAITVIAASAINVNQTSLGAAVTDQILGMNMAYWYDPSNPAILPAFKTAGIKSIRWPGGSAANVYHWATNTLCYGGQTLPSDAFDTYISDVIQPGSLDLALAVNYSTNAACNGPGDPAEAAAWVLNAKKNGNYVSHVTVGNENWGAWEPDLHAIPYDPTTYANATTNGFYPQIKAANSNVLVGVSVNPYNPTPWDSIVLAQAKYDFVEYHFYPQGPGSEDDTVLVQQAAQQLTAAINTIKAELQTAGLPNTPIFVGEIGSVYEIPGVQSTSITQALYAGQALGEMMNAGVSRSAWWIGFGGCTDSSTSEIKNGSTLYANFSSSLYGWQSFGGYMVFSDGLPESGCSSASSLPAGTLLPTARAFQLFSKVAIDGEKVLTAQVVGDTTDVRVYAATNHGGTALVVFNLNETLSKPVEITLSNQSTSSDITVETYSKALYDQSKSNVWAAPTSTDLGAQALPLALTLDPWSMNVVLVK